MAAGHKKEKQTHFEGDGERDDILRLIFRVLWNFRKYKTLSGFTGKGGVVTLYVIAHEAMEV